MLKKEEKKTLASKAQKLKSQQQITLSKDQVMDSQIRKTIKILLTKLQSCGKKVTSEKEVYIFIRQISTYQTLQLQKNLTEFTDYRIYELVHRFLDDEHNTSVLNDLIPSEEPKKKKKKGKKEEEPHEEEEKSAKK